MTSLGGPRLPGLDFLTVARSVLRRLHGDRHLFFRTVALPALLLATAGLAAGNLSDRAPRLVHQLRPLLEPAATVLALSFSVSWRRYLLLGEPPSLLYFRDPFWSYTVAVFLTGLVFVALIVALATRLDLPLGTPQDRSTFHVLPSVDLSEAGGNTVVVVLCCLPPLWVVLRHAPYYTARALGDAGLTWTHASYLMRAYVFDYALAWMLAGAPFILAQAAVAWLWIEAAQHGLLRGASLGFAFAQELLGFAWLAATSAVGTVFYQTFHDNASNNPGNS